MRSHLRHCIVRKVCRYFLLATIAGLSTPSMAQSWPDHPVKYIVPFPPGGATDIISRLVAEQLESKLGQRVVVENVSGASGSIGVGRLARSKNDGYTIGLGNSGTMTMTPHLQEVRYSPVNDFTPISMLTEYSNVLVVGKASKVTNVEEFIALAKKSKQPLTYGSAGNGSSNHMASLLFSSKAGFDSLHIPYSGNLPALMAVMSGEVDWIFATISEIKPFLESGKLTALGVTSLEADPLLPEIPAIRDTLPDFEILGFMGLFGPAEMPADISDKLSKIVDEILTAPQTIDRFASLGMASRPSSPQQLADRVKKDGEVWQSVLKQSGTSLR